MIAVHSAQALGIQHKNVGQLYHLKICSQNLDGSTFKYITKIISCHLSKVLYIDAEYHSIDRCQDMNIQDDI